MTDHLCKNCLEPVEWAEQPKIVGATGFWTHPRGSLDDNDEPFYSTWCGTPGGAEWAPLCGEFMAVPDDPEAEVCVFCDLVRRQKVEGYNRELGVVWFTPLDPVTPGHMLFVPMVHSTSAAVRPGWAGKAFRVAASYVQDQGYSANIITSIGEPASQSVNHTHIHVVPRTENDGLKLPWTGPQHG